MDDKQIQLSAGIKALLFFLLWKNLELFLSGMDIILISKGFDSKLSFLSLFFPIWEYFFLFRILSRKISIFISAFLFFFAVALSYELILLVVSTLGVVFSEQFYILFLLRNTFSGEGFVFVFLFFFALVLILESKIRPFFKILFLFLIFFSLNPSFFTSFLISLLSSFYQDNPVAVYLLSKKILLFGAFPGMAYFPLYLFFEFVYKRKLEKKKVMISS
ncbi:MAG TPA: hypothetical protein DHW82_04600 [Spirochaetia bacterium]|nr:MAG: hypothetical protein A2Y41_06225 [Spirochaetes bacterium GWB1_36_13]HCL56274.1 hypothetical protein [Spirochaetia bacterium]